jgi:hypothetical protein
VGTYEVQPGSFVTLGLGDYRFKGVFGSACTDVIPRLKGVLEYDTFGWNVGAGYDLGQIRGLSRITKHNDLTLFGGVIWGRGALVAMNFGF